MVKNKAIGKTKIIKFNELKGNKWNSNEPFRHHVLNNLFDSKFARKLREKLLKMREKRKLNFSEKTSDLFTFKQSIDLHHVDTPIIKNLVQTLESKSFIRMLSKFTGFGLSGKVDFFASIYTKGDYLLCHDDCLSTRKIAFIYYLTSLDWTISDGGYLQLFENSLEPPDQNFKNIKPTFNSLAFFEVSRKSFHRVQEVSGDRIRLSITGWYHSSEKQDIPKPIFDSKNYFSKTIKFEENDFFKLCLNPFYFDQNAKLQIRSQFLENGNIELKNFLREEAVLEFLEYDFKSRDWLYRGPFTYRNFYTKKPKQTKKSKILKLFGSKEFVNFLDFVTKDDITECNAVINKFSKGSYNLLNDFSNGFQKRTETIFNIFSKNSQKKISKLDKNTGGTIHYFKESEEQFSIDPEHNSLSIISCESGTKSLVKYHNRNCPDDFDRYEIKKLWK